MINRKFCFIILYVFIFSFSQAQDTSRVYFITSVGLLVPVSTFSNAYQNSFALNSGIEYRFSKFFYTQFVLDFNAVNYNQQLTDNNSAYLFQNTNSSLFLAGINVGRNISITKKGVLFVSPYLGAGYINIGEPRLMVDNTTNIIKQQVTRMHGVFAKQGLRLGVVTKSKLLQTLYVDASNWYSSVKVQQSTAKALSIFVGTRFGF